MPHPLISLHFSGCICYLQYSWLAKKYIKIEWQTKNIDEGCNCMGGLLNLYELTEYHNYELEYAMKLQQVSTCSLDKDLQFGT